MNTLIKITKLFAEIHWIYFTIVLVAILWLFFLLSMMNHKKVRIWIRKFELSFTIGLSGFMLIIFNILIVFCSFFFFTWIWHVKEFNSIENYFITLFLMLIFSLIFGTTSFFINLSNAKSYKSENLTQHDLFLSKETDSSNKVLEYQKQLIYLNLFAGLLDNNVSLKLLGKIKGDSEEEIRKSIKNKTYDAKDFVSTVYQINELELYYVQIKNLDTPETLITSEYILTKDMLILLDSHPSSLDTYSLSTAIREKDLNPNKYESYKSMIAENINDIQEIHIPAQNQFIEGDIKKYHVFIYSYVLEFFGLGQKYLIPLSGAAKTNHLLFGIYRFIMHGTFISLLINDIALK